MKKILRPCKPLDRIIFSVLIGFEITKHLTACSWRTAKKVWVWNYSQIYYKIDLKSILLTFKIYSMTFTPLHASISVQQQFSTQKYNTTSVLDKNGKFSKSLCIFFWQVNQISISNSVWTKSTVHWWTSMEIWTVIFFQKNNILSC